MTRRPGVLLASSDAPTRVGIGLALDPARFEVCAEAVDADAAVAAALESRPEICLVDDALSGGAVAAIEAIARAVPDTRLVLLGEREDVHEVLTAVRAGAAGALRKDLPPDRLSAIVAGVLEGEAALSRRMTFRLLEVLRTRERGRELPTVGGAAPLTHRELEVLELIGEGLRTSEIAARLSIAEVTVRRHLSGVVAKLGVADRAAAVRMLRSGG